MSMYDRLSLRVWAALTAGTAFVSSAFALAGPPSVPGLSENLDLEKVITDVLGWVLDFVALLAVVFIVISGIRLIISQGEEQEKEKAKKSIIYVVIGLIIILLSRAIVAFIGSANGLN